MSKSKSADDSDMSRPGDIAVLPLQGAFQIYQTLADRFLSPSPPKDIPKDAPTIAIIGAGITGVTAAAHCVGHGFNVVIFEAGSRRNLGGIWTAVNDSSSLQIHSAMYRFHPSIRWSRSYPDRKEILDQVEKLWWRYGLDKVTKFKVRVKRVYQDDDGRWIVNHPEHGKFEGLITAVGTCGKPKIPIFPDREKFKGPVYHSSQLNGKDAAGKRIAIIGGGASAVEVLEWAFKGGAAHASILSRSEKWIIPRNIVINTLLSWNVLGQDAFIGWLPEILLRRFFYRDLDSIAPSNKGIFTDTPMVNSDVLDHIRSGKADWVRCDVESLTDSGVLVNERAPGVPKGGLGRPRVVDADIIVMATGFKRPSLAFLPDDCFNDPYGPPNWYLQTFPPTHPSISAINCTYISAIGTVGNWHIGIYTRILLMFLTDPLTRPAPWWMRRWIDMTKLLKATSPVGAFDFFTYLELLWWFLFCICFNPFRWKWALFVFLGLGLGLPKETTELETRLLQRAGWDRREVGRDVGKSI
ncbi:hypothetical protein MGG_16410 [Pyricularia oryzae 70-15]|uniref:Monooxygenase n=3 Tax=Pyricularia oryzae TaxID=318829 RepID=G4MN24_PYRO7|nr:uncharacterized protein MGG_16410 [Pyricularia oryzae 70-15]EHA57838.1 hypothetical protein MGG_16410 [Pyricularia oryzae 70-15]ELQ41464.1 hypothetical protein OOU_Y34scaffold00277g2 [Pyricularia oryzae Y34]